MHAPYKAEEIAKFIVSHCWNEGVPVSHLEMQKILYFIQRDYLRQYNRPLFNEDFEAWQYGPVVPAAYNRFSMFVAYPIRRTYNISLSSEDETFIRDRIPEYRRKSPWEMVEDTHKPGSAWDRTWKAGKGYHQVIPQELIRIYG